MVRYESCEFGSIQWTAHCRSGSGAEQRVAVLPEVPTTREEKLDRFNANSWYGFFAPAGTPNAARRKW
jgi:tripartite-type tricarboxylate transporter receptor subunit TctC